ncbi:hypothetical protein MMC20_001687 [Loxospora ochrophaea]|nr:hypothetical protein [Loxospora ochrophaea]
MLDGNFLEFLYPSQTQAFLRRFAAVYAPFKTKNRRKCLSKREVRAYASTASEGSSLAGRILESQPNSTQSPDLDPKKALGYDDAWQEYHKFEHLQESIPQETLRNILHAFSLKSTLPDAKRSLDLFGRMPMSERQEGDYSCAIKAALRLDNLGEAMAIYEEADLRTRTGVVGSDLLQHLVTQKSWHKASEMWESYCLQVQDRSSISNIWHGLETLELEDLMAKATEALVFVNDLVTTSQIDTNSSICKFTSQLVLRALGVHGRRFNVDVQRALFRELEVICPRTLDHYALVISQAVHIGGSSNAHWAAAVRFYRQLRGRDGMVPSQSIIENVTNAMYRLDSADGLMELTDHYEEYSIYPSLALFPRIISALANHGRSEAVYRLFHQYRERTNYIRPSIFRSLLLVHSRRGEVDETITGFNKLSQEYNFEPDVRCWNIVISAFARVGNIAGALGFIERLLQSRVKPDVYTYGIMMTFYAGRGDIEAIEEWHEKAKSQRIDDSSVYMDSLVMANIQNDEIEKARGLLDEALKMRWSHNRARLTRMWNYVLNAYALRADIDTVAELRKEMAGHQIPFNGPTYAALLQCLAVARQANAAWSILKRTMPQQNIRPTALHYAVVMGGFLSTREYTKFFSVFKDMLRKGIRPSFGNRTLLIKAAADLDLEQRQDPARLQRAEDALESICENMDAMDIADREPLQTVGNQLLREAYPSNYFEYLMLTYARLGQYDKVSMLYDKYLAKLKEMQPNAEVSPPMKMLTAIMYMYLRREQYDEVERYWYLASLKAEALSRRSASKVNSEQTGWVLYSRRFILCTPLFHYMKALHSENRQEDLVTIVENLQSYGYELNHACVNQYIEYIADYEPAKAFELCETELMQDWTGWPPTFVRRDEQGRSYYQLPEPPRLHKTKKLPKYETLVKLASVFRTARQNGIFVSASQSQKLDVDALARIAPNVVWAVETMPRVNDDVQAKYLRA